jgi:hypothetical protein
MARAKSIAFCNVALFCQRGRNVDDNPAISSGSCGNVHDEHGWRGAQRTSQHHVKQRRPADRRCANSHQHSDWLSPHGGRGSRQAVMPGIVGRVV